MFTFIESPLFAKQVYDYLVDDEYAALQRYLASDPEAGAIVKGSGGVRKLRWARAGSGKSGGVRVIYFARTKQGEIWLLTIYAKSAQENIPGHVLRDFLKEMQDAAF